MRTLFRSLVVVLIALSPIGLAGAQEYRTVKLADGHVYVGEVTGTSAAGMTLRTPSGEILIPFEAALEIGPATQSDVGSQPPLPIMVLETGASSALVEMGTEMTAFLAQQVAAIPHTEVQRAADLTAEQQQSLAGCGQSIPCLIRSLQDSGVYHALVPFLDNHEDGQQVRLIALNVPGQTELGRAEFVIYAELESFPNAFLRNAYQAMGITPLEEIPDDVPILLATSGGERVTDDADAGSGDEEVPVGAELVSAGGAVDTTDETGEDATTTGGEVGSTRVKVQLSDMQRRRQVSIGLGFVPVPGLGSAHLEDPGGFALNTLFASGAGFGLVYLFGAVSPTALGFYLPAIGATYLAGVLINQISSAVSYRRYETGLTQQRHDWTPVVYASPDPAGGREAAVQFGVTRRW